MESVNELQRGFCPGLWTPMASGDGLIARVRAGVKALSSGHLRAVAELAHRYGNGQLELTARANLQLRGVREETLPMLQDAVVRLGLAEASAEREQRLAFLVNPLSGLDAECVELSATAAAIVEALRVGDDMPPVVGKFGIVLDDGTGLATTFADIRVELSRTEPELRRARLSLAGDRTSALALGACAVEDAPRAVWLLTKAFAERGPGARRRMRAWLEADGLEVVRARLGSLLLSAAPLEPARSSVSPIGYHAGICDWYGVGVPFGAAAAETWLEIAALAEQFGRGEVRMALGRAVLLLGVRAEDSERLTAAAQQLGLITHTDDPLLRAEVCPGAPACAGALGETRALARSLCRSLAPNATLHVSGCRKGCASRGSASVTLVCAHAGCKIGFDRDVAATARMPTLPLSDAVAQFDAWARAQRQVRLTGVQS